MNLTRLALIALLPMVTAGAQPATIVAPTARASDSVLVSAAARGYSGVVLVRQNGQPILRKAYGVAQRETNTPFATNTVVQIGSNTKDLTTVALLQLVHRGKLKLTDSLARFFPAAPPDKRGITVRQLLNHRSGLPLMIAPDSVLLTRDQFVARVMQAPLAFAPGSDELYSNPGFSLLAAIIEQLSGMSYDRYVADNILTPLGLRETGYHLPGFDRRRLAHGYRAGTDLGSILDLPHPADGPSWTLRGNGGMVSTVDDMAAFYQALFETEKLLPSAVRDVHYDPRGGMVLAGSDLTSFFMYQREPQLGLDVFLASTTTEGRAPQLLRAVMATLGFRGPGESATVVESAAPISFPSTPAASVVREYLDVLHSADSASAVRFFAERFLPTAGTAPPPERFRRLTAMRANLGRLVPVRYTAKGEEVELVARSEAGDGVTLLFEIESAAPHRIRSLRIQVGGG